MLPPRGLSATKVIFWLRLSVQMRSPPAITAASLKRGKRCWKSWQGMNQRSHPFLVRGAITKRCCEAQIASSSYSSRLRRGKHYWRSWQGMNQRSLFLMLRGAIASSNCSSRLRRGKRCGQSWEGMNERSLFLILQGAIALGNYSSRWRRPSLFSEALRQHSDLLWSLCKLS